MKNAIEKTEPISVKSDENSFAAISIDPKIGLTSAEVKERIDKGFVNGDFNVPTKSYGQIFFSNIFTLFNIINIILALLVLSAVDDVKDLLDIGFMGLVIVNAATCIIQEIKSKKTIDKLSLISAPKVNVIRDGNKIEITMKDIVINDIMQLSSGNQICADSVVVDGECEVNESLITGEPDAILKKAGDKLLSGSYIVSGTCRAQVEHIAQDNYAAKISSGAKYIKKPNSEILNSVRGVIRIITFLLFPLGIITLAKQIWVVDQPYNEAIPKAVAGIISMIPSGLVLLTTMVFTVSVVKLAVHKTSVQDLYCIETLARVDVLCLDKTGTITEGSMILDDIVPIDYEFLGVENKVPSTEVTDTATCNAVLDHDTLKDSLAGQILSNMCHILQDSNATFCAISDAFHDYTDWTSSYNVPFSSARKWSAVSFDNKGSYIMGAAEFVLGDKYSDYSKQIESYSMNGQRVLVLCHSDSIMSAAELPQDIKVIALILISDKIRPEANDTLRFFAEEGVDLKIISGDNPVTVSQIARRAGLEGYEKYVDATTLKTDEDIALALDKYKIFGRVTPDQKLTIVKELKKKGHTVAMTGDGVNDVLALKESDCSVAMAAGADAAKNVASLVLLDNNFASMPLVVAEGRKSINNLQRSASLYFIKTIYATTLAFFFIFVKWAYPFLPRQLTLISTLTYGIPSIILALEPNYERVKGKFIDNAMNNSIPGAITIVICIIAMMIGSHFLNLSTEMESTMATMILASIMFVVLFKLCVPFNLIRFIMYIGVVIVFIIMVFAFSNLFDFVLLSSKAFILMFCIIAAIIPLMLLIGKLVRISLSSLRLTHFLLKVSQSNLKWSFINKDNNAESAKIDNKNTALFLSEKNTEKSSESKSH